jgi:pyruvate,water dikinase
LGHFASSPIDVEKLLEKQRAEFEAAWGRFKQRYPRQAKTTRQNIEKAAASTRLREAARSEATRVVWVIRAFALQFAELCHFDDRQAVFFLSLTDPNRRSDVYEMWPAFSLIHNWLAIA